MPSLLARMRDAVGFGRIFSSPPAAERARGPGRPPGPTRKVVTELPLYLQLQRVGGNLTPQKVSQIIREADVGRMYRIVDLTNEFRQKDLHMQAILETHETELSGLEWQVTAPPNASAEEQKCTDFCNLALRSIAELPDLFAHLAGGFLNSHAVAETLIEKIDRQLVPVGFDHINSRRFCYDLAAGHLRWWDQAGDSAANLYPGIDLQEEWPGKFIQFTPRVVGDVQCREGLARPLLWAALFRNWDLRDWLSLAELSWKPWRTGMYQKGASDEDIANLISILESMTASAIAVYPNTTEVKIEWPKNLGPQGAPHAQLFDILGREMSKAVLGSSTTMELAKNGNQTASKTGAEMQRTKRDARAKRMAACVKLYLLTPMTRMNYGPDIRVPGFEYVTEDEVDVLNYAQGVKALVDAGLRKIPARHVRDKVGIPEAVGDEEVLDEPAEEPDAAPDGDGGKKPPVGDKPTKKPAGKKPPKKKPTASGADAGDGGE